MRKLFYNYQSQVKIIFKLHDCTSTSTCTKPKHGKLLNLSDIFKLTTGSRRAPARVAIDVVGARSSMLAGLRPTLIDLKVAVVTRVTGSAVARVRVDAVDAHSAVTVEVRAVVVVRRTSASTES